MTARSAIGFGTAALALAVARPASAAPPAPAPGSYEVPLEVSSLRVRAGEVVNVTGRGCRQGERVDLAVFSPHAQPVGSLATGMGGLFEATIRLPADAQPGRLWIRASCGGADGRPRVMDATLAVRSPAVVITGVNLLFGAGAALAVAGFGLAGRRRPARGKRRRRPERAVRPRPRGRLLRRRRRRRPRARRPDLAARP